MNERTTTRCKFTCTGVTKRTNPYHGQTEPFLYNAEFTCVTDGSDENKKFFKWTPSGTLHVGVYTEDRFTPGKTYYLDITEAE